MAVGPAALRPSGARRRVAGALERPALRRDRRPPMVDSALARAHPRAAGATGARLPGSEALPRTGRSRGGPGTRLHAVVEARGRPVEGVVTPGQASDHGPAEAPIGGRAGGATIAGRGYDADRLAERTERRGSRAALPPRSHRSAKPRALDAAPDRPRHRIEFFCNRPKHFRRSEAPPRMPRATVRGTASDDRPQLPRHGPARPHPNLDQVRRRAVGPVRARFAMPLQSA